MLTRVEHEYCRRYPHFFIVDTITEVSHISAPPPSFALLYPAPVPTTAQSFTTLLSVPMGYAYENGHRLCIYMFIGCCLLVLPTPILCCVLRSGWQLGTGETERCLEADLTCPTEVSMSGARQQRAAEVGAIAVPWVGVGWRKET